RRDRDRGDADRPGLRSDVDHERRVAGLAALFGYRLRYQEDEVARLLLRIRRPGGDRYAQDRERGVPAPVGRHLQPADLGSIQVRRRRLPRPGEQLLPVDDLEQAFATGAVGEVDAVALNDRSMHAVSDGNRPGRTWLLSGQAEVAHEHGLRRVTQIVDLGHAPRAPARRPEVEWLGLDEITGDQIGRSRVALPEVLVRR